MYPPININTRSLFIKNLLWEPTGKTVQTGTGLLSGGNMIFNMPNQAMQMLGTILPISHKIRHRGSGRKK